MEYDLNFSVTPGQTKTDCSIIKPCKTALGAKGNPFSWIERPTKPRRKQKVLLKGSSGHVTVKHPLLH